MPGYEVEARELLLRRRRSLAGGTGERRQDDPASRWVDVEGIAEPPPEPVRRELSAIDEALRRIHDGRYGTCLACGGPLGLQRIRAIPEARYCLGCSGQGARDDEPR
jgi:RNA polymerase-binding transcription factor DksA